MTDNKFLFATLLNFISPEWRTATPIVRAIHETINYTISKEDTRGPSAICLPLALAVDVDVDVALAI